MSIEGSRLNQSSFVELYVFLKQLNMVVRRVHITEETLHHLNEAYQVEDGNGGSRDPLLQGRETYLVIDPRETERISRRPKVVSVRDSY